MYDKALATAEEILDMETPHYADENYIDIIRAKQTTATSVLNMGLKADENRLRRKETDIISKLYEAVKLEQEMKTIEG